jgi:3,4-dihydroxy 2-butanone 4-phosphate synthase / GTP cyclohydrolase II
MSQFHSIDAALKAFRKGDFVIVVDDEDRENEGDLVIAAEHITEQKMAFIIRHTGGVVCLPLSNSIADTLGLPHMVHENSSRFGTAFTVSIEAAKGVTTGISAKDRATTIRAAISPKAKRADLRRPGHVFPLRAQAGGVLVRAGHTEAVIDLCRLTGKREGGVLSELMHDDGTMMRLPALINFAKQHKIPVVSIADLIHWRRKNETMVEMEAQTTLDTDFGKWDMRVYHDHLHQKDHVALVKGNVRGTDPVLVRVHSECVTGDVFHSQHCDCGRQLDRAMEEITKAGRGVILYLRQEGRGIGLVNKIKAYSLQTKKGLDTVQANRKLGLPVDLRDYGIGAQILRHLGIRKIKLLTNNPKKIVGLEGYGLEVTKQVPLELAPRSMREKKYLQTKKKKMGHTLKIKN